MTENNSETRPPTKGFSIPALHIFGLCTLAVAHPLYAVLGQSEHAPFFIAHESRSIDIWLFILVWSIALPASICLVLWMVKLLSRRLAAGLYVTLLFILFFAAFLPLPSRWLDEPAAFGIILASIGAALATAIYAFARSVRSFVTIMSLAVVVSPTLFLYTPSMRSFMSSPEAQDFSIDARASEAPDIVMIIFDELPLISLLDENHEIDKTRYPNFYRLAQTATWYRNTTSVHYSTSYAVTELLVGNRYRKYLEVVHETPVSRDGPIDRERVPFNLFSLLEDNYQIFAKELVTKLTSESPESTSYVRPLEERLRELLVDSSIVYAHLAAPASFRANLPQIEGQWRGFFAKGSEEQTSPEWPFEDSYKRTSVIQEFIESLQKRNAPSLYFLHSLLPHFPFVYNERGQLLSNKLRFLTMHFREATGSNDWPSEQAADLAYQAHLLQLGFTDLLLGRIIERLDAQHMFDDSLIIVTSDHGTSYYWDSDHQPAEQLAEIQASGTLYVPLFIKLPGQAGGSVSDKPLQTIDIGPTLADILDLDVSWPISGLSALGAVPHDRQRFSFLPERFSVKPGLEEMDRALARKIELFGTNNFERIYSSGPQPDFVGKPLTDFVSRPSGATVKLRPPGRTPSVDPGATRIPTYVDGQILHLPEQMKASELVVAIAVNGIIKCTTRTTRLDTSSLSPQSRNPSWHNGVEDEPVVQSASQHGAYFLALLPPDAYAKGRNEVTVHAILPGGPDAQMSLLDFDDE